MLLRLSGPAKSRYPLPYAILALILAVSTVLAGLAHSARADQRNVMPPATQRDITYCAPGGVPLKMDIYMPENAGSRPSPAALFVHGGSWASGDKASSEGAPETVELLRRGYLVAAINYRLFPNYVFPAQIEDVKCAVRYLRANAASLNVDPDRIGAWGASAGGQLVSLLGVTDPTAGLEGDGGYEGVSSSVAAVVDMFGRADLSEVPQTRPDLLPVFGGAQELARYSPVTYVSPDDPPFLILHGNYDTTVPPELSQEFYDRLKLAGVPATLVMVKNAGHGFAPVGGLMSPSRSDITALVGDFFDRYLKTYPPPSVPTPSVRAQTLPAGGDVMQVAATGKEVRSPFLDYWRGHGAIAQQGYPISAEMQEWSANGSRPYTVQYFERAVYEYHPENQPPYDVLASLLGAQRYRARYPGGAPNQRPNMEAGSVYFEQTG